MTRLDELPPERWRKIKLVVCDVDGVLTDGGIGITSDGADFKIFNAKDGAGFDLWHRAGGLTAFLTGRGGAAVERRAAELKVDCVVTQAAEKLPRLREIGERLNVPLDEILYVGDDFPDAPCLRAAGIGVAVADATAPALAAAAAVTTKTGGRGAVREIFDFLLAGRDTN
ncbi:MAG: HAD hydrolase family protein [Planctomycetota bacterium]|jgi:3-deoxy-D-manno-octulosonate 8-phosphate phosphatase (KDO 8-P phosphatase)|nr:HAD hydrolase family protein [Planctomycetota bacterium]